MSKKKKKPAKPAKQAKHAALLGLGFDNDDGHKRLTTGEHFAIIGGSEETHGRMTETVVKTFEEPVGEHGRVSPYEAQRIGYGCDAATDGDRLRRSIHSAVSD